LLEKVTTATLLHACVADGQVNIKTTRNEKLGKQPEVGERWNNTRVAEFPRTFLASLDDILVILHHAEDILSAF